MNQAAPRQRIRFLLAALATGMALILFFLLFTSPDIAANPNIKKLTRWYDADGAKTLPIQTDKTPGATSRIAATIPTLTTASFLIFRTENVLVDVAVDGKPYYTMQPVPAHHTLGDQWHFVHIPVADSGKTVLLNTTILFAQGSNNVRAVYLATRGDFMQAMFAQKLSGYLVSALVFLLGLLYLISSNLITRQLGVHAPASFAFFCLSMGMWSMVQTGIPELLYGVTPLIHLVTYVSLPFSVGMLSLYLSTLPCAPWLRQTYRVLFAYLMLHSVAAVLLDHFCVLAYVETLPLVRGVMGVLAALFLFQIRWLLREYQEYFLFVCGLFCMALTFGADMVFLSSGTYDYAHHTRFGVFWLTLMVALQYAEQVRANIKRADEADVMRRLAYRDALTGLHNRLALVRDQEALLTQCEGCVGIVQMDINHLKHVNDTYGHEEGDALIQRAAKAIDAAFGQSGTCYRVGGDEFVALITKDACEATYQDCLKRLAVTTAQQNVGQKHQLSIALGFAIYQPAMGDRFYDLVRAADMRMYARKREMKGIDSLAELQPVESTSEGTDWKSLISDAAPVCAVPITRKRRWWARLRR